MVQGKHGTRKKTEEKVYSYRVGKRVRSNSLNQAEVQKEKNQVSNQRDHLLVTGALRHSDLNVAIN